MDRVDDSCDMNPLSRLAGGIYIDHLFERLVEDTIIEITDQQPEEWGDALREAKSELMRLWHGGFKQSFTGLLSSRQITFKIEPTDTYIDITKSVCDLSPFAIYKHGPSPLRSGGTNQPRVKVTISSPRSSTRS